jgi:hypothetical protein
MGGKSIEKEQEIAGERKAVMNPSAVEKAKVYKGRVYYYKGSQYVNLPETVLVEVGKWTGEGEERNPEDYLSTGEAARLLGLEPIHWLPAGDDNSGDRKLLIAAGETDEGVLISFSEERAERIAHAINTLFSEAKFQQGVLSGPELRYGMISHDGITHPVSY